MSKGEVEQPVQDCMDNVCGSGRTQACLKPVLSHHSAPSPTLVVMASLEARMEGRSTFTVLQLSSHQHQNLQIY